MTSDMRSLKSMIVAGLFVVAVIDTLKSDTSRAGGRGVFVRADISATGGIHASRVAPVRAYFRRGPDGWKFVGFDRMPDAPPMRPGLVGAERRL